MTSYILDVKDQSIEFKTKKQAVDYSKQFNFDCKLTRYINDDFDTYWILNNKTRLRMSIEIFSIHGTNAEKQIINQ